MTASRLYGSLRRRDPFDDRAAPQAGRARRSCHAGVAVRRRPSRACAPPRRATAERPAAASVPVVIGSQSGAEHTAADVFVTDLDESPARALAAARPAASAACWLKCETETGARRSPAVARRGCPRDFAQLGRREVSSVVAAAILAGRRRLLDAQAALTDVRAMRSTHAPVICLVATFARLYALIVAIATTSAASCGSV